MAFVVGPFVIWPFRYLAFSLFSCFASRSQWSRKGAVVRRKRRLGHQTGVHESERREEWQRRPIGQRLVRAEIDVGEIQLEYRDRLGRVEQLLLPPQIR